jgi:hypothetical protein
LGYIIKVGEAWISTLLAHGTNGQQRDVAPGDMSASFVLVGFPVESTLQQEAREADEGSTGQPHRTAEGQREDVGDKGEGWLSEQEGNAVGNTDCSVEC